MDTLATSEGQIWVGLFAFLGSILSTAVMLYTQARNRRWQKEDAAAAAQELAEKTAALAAELKRETRQHAKELGAKLDHNTELTGMAYNAANNFELKLERLAKVFDSVHTDRETMRHLTELTADTNQAILTDIQPDVAAIKDAVTRDHKDGG